MGTCLLKQLKEQVNVPNLPSILNFKFTGAEFLDIMANEMLVTTFTDHKIVASDETNLGTTIYIGSVGDAQIVTDADNPNRLVTDFIQVKAGMKITSFAAIGTSSTPVIICFDSSKTPLAPVSAANYGYDNEGVLNFTIPSGCEYIKIQQTGLFDYTWVQGSNLE